MSIALRTLAIGILAVAIVACGDGGNFLDKENGAAPSADHSGTTTKPIGGPSDSGASPGNAPGDRSSALIVTKVLNPSTSDKRPVGYTDLLFADEFAGTELNRSNWCTRLMWGGSPSTLPLQIPDLECTGWGAGTLDFVNEEQHRFRDFNAAGERLHTVGGGVLSLRATVLSSDPANPTFESAMIRGKTLMVPNANKSYYITGRYRLPDVLGSLPQVWLAPSLEPSGASQWPPEIDIFEGPYNLTDGAEDLYQVTQVRSQQTSTGTRRLYSAAPNYNQEYGFITAPASLRNTWLEIGAEWTADSVCFFIDGKQTVCDYYRWVSNDGLQGNPAAYIANMAVGGGWAGRDGIDLSKFPLSLDVDYVRIYEKTYLARSGRAGDITAAATLSGQQPKPTAFPGSNAYYAVNARRLDGGAIQATASNTWSLHSIDAGSPINNPHEFTFEGLSGTTGFGVNFGGTGATNAANTGVSAGIGYSVRLTRTKTTAPWTATLLRNDQIGSAPASLQTSTAALPANVVNAAVRVNATAQQIAVVITPDTGSEVVFNVNDSAHRGNWVGAETFATSGNGPLMTEIFGVNVPDAATVPGPTPGQAPTPPKIAYPMPESTLTGATQPFYWWGADVTSWWLYVGSTPGGAQYFDSGGLGAATNVTVNGLPTDGSTVHATLFYRQGAGEWQSTSETFTATGVMPTVTTPAAGATLAGASASFQWTGANVNAWWLYVGSANGSNDYFDSGNLGTATSTTVTNLPVDGSTVHARLWYQNVGNVWQSRDFTYTASTAAAPAISLPVPGSTLPGASQVFSWTGDQVAEWWLYAGSTIGGNQYFDSGSLNTTRTVNVTNLPTFGNTVHIRLWYRYPGASWQPIDATYTASGTSPVLNQPVPGSTLSGSSRLFQWSDPGGTITQWWLYAGSTPGGKDHFDSGSLNSATSVTATGLPVTAVPIHVTLWFRSGSGAWQSLGATYTGGP